MLFTKTKFLLTLSAPTEPLSSPIVTQLDHFLKLSRRKQTIYYKLIDLSISLQSSSSQKLDLPVHLSYITKDFNLLLFQQQQLIKEIDDITYNRNLFYTLFVRIMEILDQTKNRLKNKEVWGAVDEQKKALGEFYSNQSANGKYEIVGMIRMETNGANNRIRRMLLELNKIQNSGQSSKNSIAKDKSVLDREKEIKQTKEIREIKEMKEKEKERQKHLLSPAKTSKQQKQKKWFKEFKEFGLQRNRQFTKEIPRSSNDFSLNSKTIQLSFRPKKVEESLAKVKAKNTNKMFNKLYKPIDVKLEVIEEKKEIIRVTLQRLMEKNKEIEKEIGNYSIVFDEKKKGKEKQKEFRIKVKNVGHSV